MYKSRSARYKAAPAGSEPGTFSAVVAVYGNVDSAGERIVDGAFDVTLKSWRATGDPIPIVLEHDWKDPFSHIGFAMPDKVKSVPGVGLVVEEGHLDLDNPVAAQVYRLMERRSLKEFSFGYNVPSGGQKKAKDGAMELKSLDLIEFGPCLKGVNDQTQLLSLKAAVSGQVDDPKSMDDRMSGMESRMSSVEDDVASLMGAPAGTGTKSMMMDLPGSFEDVSSSARDALSQMHDGKYVSVQATYSDHVMYSLSSDGLDSADAGAEYFTCDFEIVDGEVVLGTPEPVEVTPVVKPAGKSESSSGPLWELDEDDGSAAVDPGPEADALDGTDGADVKSQDLPGLMAAMSIDGALSALEHSTDLRSVLAQDGLGDAAMRQMEEIEQELK